MNNIPIAHYCYIVKLSIMETLYGESKFKKLERGGMEGEGREGGKLRVE